MQLKIRRSQKDAGMLSKSVVFMLDARIQLTPHEQGDLKRYKLHNQVIYNSAASEKHLARADVHLAAFEDRANGMRTLSALRSLASSAIAALQLNITVKSLEEGQHIECKSLDEVLAAEQALTEACQNMKAYLQTAAMFNGTEQVIDFDARGGSGNLHTGLGGVSA